MLCDRQRNHHPVRCLSQCESVIRRRWQCGVIGFGRAEGQDDLDRQRQLIQGCAVPFRLPDSPIKVLELDARDFLRDDLGRGQL